MKPDFKTLSQFYLDKKISPKYWTETPPLWPPGYTATQADIALARELYRCLDRASQEWYGRYSPMFGDIYEEIRKSDPFKFDDEK